MSHSGRGSSGRGRSPPRWHTRARGGQDFAGLPYQNGQYGFALTYPAGWKTRSEIKPDRRRIYFEAPQSQVLAFVEVRPRWPGSDPYAVWEKEHQRLTEKDRERYQRISLQRRKLGGEPAAQWVFNLTFDSGLLVRRINVGAWHQGQGYALLCQAPAAEAPKWEKTFRQMMDSFRFE